MRLKSRAVIGSHAILRGVLHNFHSSLQPLFLVPSGARARFPQRFPGSLGKTDEPNLLPDISSRINYRSSTPVLLRHNRKNFYAFIPGRHLYQRLSASCSKLHRTGRERSAKRGHADVILGGGVDLSCLFPRSLGPAIDNLSAAASPSSSAGEPPVGLSTYRTCSFV